MEYWSDCQSLNELWSSNVNFTRHWHRGALLSLELCDCRIDSNSAWVRQWIRPACTMGRWTMHYRQTNKWGIKFFKSNRMLRFQALIRGAEKGDLKALLEWSDWRQIGERLRWLTLWKLRNDLFVFSWATSQRVPVSQNDGRSGLTLADRSWSHVLICMIRHHDFTSLTPALNSLQFTIIIITIILICIIVTPQVTNYFQCLFCAHPYQGQELEAPLWGDHWVLHKLCLVGPSHPARHYAPQRIQPLLEIF